MTDYAVTLKKRKANKLGGKIRADRYYHFEGSEANNNWHVQLFIRKDVTAAANNDTITITLG